MPVSGYTIGQDIKIDIVDASGLVTLSKIVSFNATPVVTDKTIQPMNGTPEHLTFIEGWSGTIEGERDDDSVDSFWARREAAYFSGEDILSATISQTIKETGGSLSRYLFTKVQFKLDDAGAYKGNDSVMWRMSFGAGRRLKVL